MLTLPESLTLRDGEVVLRDWRDDDEAALKPLFGDPDVSRFSSLALIYSPSAALDHLEQLRQKRAAGKLLALAVTRNGGRPLGNVNLVFRFGPDIRLAALGYWLAPAERGQGLAVVATRMLCEWGFTELALGRIELLIDPENASSLRVAERIGGLHEGLRPHEANGQVWEMVMYSLSPPLAR